MLLCKLGIAMQIDRCYANCMKLEDLIYKELKSKVVTKSGNVYISRELVGKELKHSYTTYKDKEVHIFICKKNLRQKKEEPKAPTKILIDKPTSDTAKSFNGNGKSNEKAPFTELCGLPIQFSDK